MDINELEALSAKVADGSASKEELLLFLKEMNEAMESIHNEITAH